MRILLAGGLLLAASAAIAIEPGREGMLFLRLTGDSRSAALGPGEASLTEGESALFGNPAAAALRRQLAISDTVLFWPAGFFGETLAALWPVGKRGALGGSLFLLRHSALPVTTEIQPEGTGTMAAMLDVELALMGSQWLTEILAVGATLRVAQEQLGSLENRAAAADLGLLAEVTPEWVLGLAVRGIGQIVRVGDLRDYFPFSIDAGARFQPAFLPLRVYAGGIFRPYGLSEGGPGLEFGEWRGGTLRASARLREDGGMNLAAGLGLHMDMWHLDYAFGPAGELGYFNRLTLSVRFGEAAR